MAEKTVVRLQVLRRQHLFPSLSFAVLNLLKFQGRGKLPPLSCIQPGLQYFTTQVRNSMRLPLVAFKAARLLNPQKVAEMLPSASDVDDLSSFSLQPVQCFLISKLNCHHM